MEQATKQIRTRPCPRCFLCDAEGKLLYQNLTARMFSAPGQWDFRICPLAGCGLMWLDPTPVTEDLPVAYDSYFTHGRTDGPLGAAALLRDALYRLYQVASALPAALVGLQAEKRRMASMFLGKNSPGKLLDVGCGDGQKAFMAGLFIRLVNEGGATLYKGLAGQVAQATQLSGGIPPT